MSTSQLQLSNISKVYHQANSTIPIFDAISYKFHTGTSYALMGPSGIGKSTLLNMIAGLEQPSSGTISIDNQNISGNNFEEKIAKLHNAISIIFQQPCLIHELSTLENVMLPAIAHNQINQATTLHAHQLLTDVGLADHAWRAPNTLSGGQQQRIAILRALFYKPTFLLADEPTGNLDAITAEQIINLLKTYQQKYNMGLIISTHDIKIAQQCDVILEIQSQKLITINS